MPNHRSSVMMLPKPSAEERTMTPQIKSHPIISKLIDAFGNWRKHRQEIREIGDLYDDEFSTLELRIAPADLDTFVRQGPHAVDELPKLLTALGIDEKGAVSHPTACAA
jgi:uncharacterized protein YjiS (DUF1127 family)